MRKIRNWTLLGLACLGLNGTAQSAQVKLGWMPSTDPSVIGYKIYYGTNSSNYTTSINEGNVTNCMVTNLTDGITYYFAATAYNASNLESSFSDQVVWTAPTATTITLGNLVQTYSGTPEPVTVTTSPAGISPTVTYNGSTNAPVNAGTYTIIAFINNTNNVGATTNILKINPEPVTITLTKQVQTYTGNALAIGTSCNVANVPIAVTYNGSPTTPSQAGTYTITATATGGNYTGSAAGTFTIDTATGTVTVGNLDQTYDGTGKNVSVATSPTGLATTTTYNGSSEAPTNAGNYTVVTSINDPNYTGSSTQILAVAQAAAIIHLNNLTQSWTGAAITVNATTTPTNLPVNITYNGSATAPTNSGYYQVIGTVQNPNYTGSVTNQLTIQPGSPKLFIGALNQIYNGTPKIAMIRTSPAGLATTTTYNGSTNPPINIGTYTVVASITQPNYTPTNVTAAMHILSPQKAIVISWPNNETAPTLYESTNLTDWTAMSVDTSFTNHIVVEQKAGDHFFRAIPNNTINSAVKLTLNRPQT